MAVAREQDRRRRHLEQLVQEHRETLDTPVLLAVWWRQNDSDLWLLEVAEGVSDPGDASWDTFQFMPRPEWHEPSGTKLRITYLSPEEFLAAADRPDSRGHTLLQELRRNSHEVLFEAGGERSARVRQLVAVLEGEDAV